MKNDIVVHMKHNIQSIEFSYDKKLVLENYNKCTIYIVNQSGIIGVEEYNYDVRSNVIIEDNGRMYSIVTYRENVKKAQAASLSS